MLDGRILARVGVVVGGGRGSSRGQVGRCGDVQKQGRKRTGGREEGQERFSISFFLFFLHSRQFFLFGTDVNMLLSFFFLFFVSLLFRVCMKTKEEQDEKKEDLVQ